MAGKFGSMPMPKKGKKEEASVADEMDLFGEGESAEETDGTIEDEGSELDLGEDKKELAALSDDELLAEVKKRGLSLEGKEEAEEVE